MFIFGGLLIFCIITAVEIGKGEKEGLINRGYVGENDDADKDDI